MAAAKDIIQNTSSPCRMKWDTFSGLIRKRPGNRIRMTITEDKIYKALEQVMDPEIPVLNVLDLGMITAVQIGEDGAVFIKMIPTFSACPAVELIRNNIRST